MLWARYCFSNPPFCVVLFEGYKKIWKHNCINRCYIRLGLASSSPDGLAYRHCRSCGGPPGAGLGRQFLSLISFCGLPVVWFARAQWWVAITVLNKTTAEERPFLSSFLICCEIKTIHLSQRDDTETNEAGLAERWMEKLIYKTISTWRTLAFWKGTIKQLPGGAGKTSWWSWNSRTHTHQLKETNYYKSLITRITFPWNLKLFSST